MLKRAKALKNIAISGAKLKQCLYTRARDPS
jgi:hypothetical protein